MPPPPPPAALISSTSMETTDISELIYPWTICERWWGRQRHLFSKICLIWDSQTVCSGAGGKQNVKQQKYRISSQNLKRTAIIFFPCENMLRKITATENLCSDIYWCLIFCFSPKILFLEIINWPRTCLFSWQTNEFSWRNERTTYACPRYSTQGARKVSRESATGSSILASSVKETFFIVMACGNFLIHVTKSLFRVF